MSALAVGAAVSDFLLRLAFFTVAPLGLVLVASVVPVTGALIQLGLFIVVFLTRELVMRGAARWKVLGALVGRQLELDAYYRASPPRHFAYYIFYILLFPYWLSNAHARKEYSLFRGYTGFTLVLLFCMGTLRFFRDWWPELPLTSFLGWLVVGIAVEWVIVLQFLMPIATTIVGHHLRRQHGRLAILMMVGIASAAVAAVRIKNRHDPVVPLEARARVILRSQLHPARARETELEALRAAWRAQAKSPSRVEGDGKLEGEPVAAARRILQAYYKIDEADAFDLWAAPRKKPKLLVLYTESRQGRPALWVGLTDKQEVVTDVKKLPDGALKQMRHAIR
jgi:hypothetical protein